MPCHRRSRAPMWHPPVRATSAHLGTLPLTPSPLHLPPVAPAPCPPGTRKARKGPEKGRGSPGRVSGRHSAALPGGGARPSAGDAGVRGGPCASSPAEGDPAGRGVTALWSRGKTSGVREGTAHGLHPAADPARAGCAVLRARPPRPEGPRTRTVLRGGVAPGTPAAHAVDAAGTAPGRRPRRRTDHADRTGRRRHGPSRVSGGSRSPPAFERLSAADTAAPSPSAAPPRSAHRPARPCRPAANTRRPGPGGIPEIATRRPATVRSARHPGNARGDVAQPTGVRP